ncbi:MAG: nickel pincer cofactor biosynthesis protein LarB [Candidatus Thermoplasmatota archaeon]|nr:nickel pincer cofactor biosynthesis protein LarB [Candidatus Thermoplasmatota archaeon]MBU1941729.1 nickel pincer cofactor biosynthesis protein LarB [Candidatus Thermoplasmatota archaeon]
MKKLLEDYKNGKIPLEDVLNYLRSLPYQNIGHTKIDTHRHLRKEFPETIFCMGKTPEQIITILKKMAEHGHNLLATKATPQIYHAVKPHFPTATYHQEARMISIIQEPITTKKQGTILIITAGTSDIPIAEEAALTAHLMGNTVETEYDVGIAGIHRLLDIRTKLQKATVIIVVAGMEGALPSIVGGLTSKPVIAVPTSIGYGASFQGIAPLLTMLNSCAEGIVVVNIDNGFGAGYFASLINK